MATCLYIQKNCWQNWFCRTNFEKDRLQHEYSGQTACMVVNPCMVDSFASLFLIAQRKSVIKLNDDSFLHLVQKLGAWLSMSMIGTIGVLFVVFLVLAELAIEPHRFVSSQCLLLYVSVQCFIEEVQGLYADQTYVCNLELHQNYGWNFMRINWLKPLPSKHSL